MFFKKLKVVTELFVTGSASQKGTVMGILRSLGALARAIGPIMSATGNSVCIYYRFCSGQISP